jgi:hypothetical protein
VVRISGRVTVKPETMSLSSTIENLQRDLCRVNFEVSNLKPFPRLTFPHLLISEKVPKQPSFDGELMASIRSWLRSSCLAENRWASFDSPLECQNSGHLLNIE